VSRRARIGLFSTLTGAGSRALVTAVAEAWHGGTLGDVDIAFLFCNRGPGESALTDASAVALEARLGVPVVRASAARFRTAERRAARERDAAGDAEALWAWRDAYYATFADLLPATDLDLLLGDMWIWGRRQCAARRGVNLHPALPTGPLGKMWFDVIWDLIAAGAAGSGVMLHRVTPEVDRGPVVTYCRYGLRGPETDSLWSALPECLTERTALIASQRALKREATHPLFGALRARGLARELPLMLETVRSVAGGRLRLEGDSVLDAAGVVLDAGLDLTAQVERAVAGAVPSAC